MLSLIEKIKILAIKKRVSDSDIRTCIGVNRYYRIESGESDLPYEKMMELFKLVNANILERAWFVSETDNYPENVAANEERQERQQITTTISESEKVNKQAGENVEEKRKIRPRVPESPP